MGATVNPALELALVTAKIILLGMESQTPEQRARSWERWFDWLDRNDANLAEAKAFFAHLLAEIKK